MTMYRTAAFGLLVLLAVFDSHAESQAENKGIAFDKIQTECDRAGVGVGVGVNSVTAAALGRAASCQVTRGRWFSTIEHDDFYQAQYCLQGMKTQRGDKNCQQRALLLFANRAYTPTARLALERIDPAGTAYDDPQVYVTADGYVLKLTVRLPKGAAQTSYYRWQDDRWEPIDTLSWRDTVAGFLPAGSRIGKLPSPDFESMRSEIDFFRQGEKLVAEVDFQLSGTRLAIKSLRTLVR